jgi:hypothetical protein
MTHALRTCPECGATAVVTSRTKHPFTRTCQACSNQRKIHLMWAANRAQRANPPEPREPDPFTVDMLVAGIPERATVAERIAAIRRMPKLTAAQLAARMGVSERSVVRYRARMRAS